MSSSAALSESMRRITTSKLNVLKKQLDAFERKKQATLDAVQRESALPEQLLILLDALIIHDVPAVVPNLSPDNKSDPQIIKAYLSNLFESTESSKKLTKSPLETLRMRLRESDLDPFDKDTLKRTIAGLLNSELLAPSKKAALMDINGNDLVLGEMLNGKYRVYMDEELLQALLRYRPTRRLLLLPTPARRSRRPNPLIPLLLAREVEDTTAQQERKIGEVEKQKDPKEWIQQAFERDEVEYEVYKKRYDEGEVGDHKNNNKPNKHNDSDEEDRSFMSFEEFTAYREDTSLPLLHAYLRLREEPPQTKVTLTADVQAALKQLSDGQVKEGIHGDIWMMDGYWKWVTQLYAGDVLARFGGLGMGEKKLLPLGLVTMLRGGKK
ncbi:MAG: hypothetical protein Q9173_004571 [Seirophora scorigena]